MTLQNILIIVFSSKIFITSDNSYFLWHFKKNCPISHKYISLPIKVPYPNGNFIFNFLW